MLIEEASFSLSSVAILLIGVTSCLISTLLPVVSLFNGVNVARPTGVELTVKGE